MDADVAVVGVGTMGSMAAWQLAERGTSVIGFDQFAPGHDQSGAGGESRIFRTAYQEGTSYIPLLQRSLTLWRELETQTGSDLLTLTGGLTIGRPDTEAMQNVLQGIEQYGLNHAVLTPSEVGDRFPAHHLGDDEIAILDPVAGYVKPELAVLTAARRAEAIGARLHRYTKIVDIQPDASGVTLHSLNRSWRVGKVIVTAGAWTQNLVPSSGDHYEIIRIVLAWWIPKRPELFTAERFPIFVRLAGDASFSGWPTVDGTTVKIGRNGSHGTVADADALDRNVAQSWMVKARRVVREFLPDLEPDPVRISAYMDGWTSTMNPVIGNVWGMDNVMAMYGFSGHGFKMAPVMGEIAAELVTNGSTEFDLRPFAVPQGGEISLIPRA